MVKQTLADLGRIRAAAAAVPDDLIHSRSCKHKRLGFPPRRDQRQRSTSQSNPRSPR